MTDLLHEQLSALIDGELRTQETALLLKRLGCEPELRARLARYRASGETLRGARLQPTSDFTLRICAALAAEACHARGAGRGLALARRLLRPAAGLSVAAAVAGAAILVLGRPGGLAGAPATVAARPPAAVPAVAARLAAAEPQPLQRVVEERGDFSQLTGEPRSYVTPAPRQGLGVIPRGELANYVVVHSQVSGPLGRSSALMDLVTDDSGSLAAPAR